MKKSAILINTARGKVVDETALVKALNEKIISGADLDIFEKEPLPVDDPTDKARKCRTHALYGFPDRGVP